MGEDINQDSGNLPGANPDQNVNTDDYPKWLDAVKQDIRDKHMDELKDKPNINPVLEDYFSLKAKVEKAIFKPGEGATPEDIAQYKEQMGIPSDVNAYEFDAPPEGVEAQEEFQTWFKDISLKTNLSKEQAKVLYNEWNQLQLKGIEAEEAARKEAFEAVEKELHKEYGADYESVVANAARIIKLGGEDLQGWLDETGAGNDPRFVRVFAKLGSMISEDSIGPIQSRNKGPSHSLADRLYPNQGREK